MSNPSYKISVITPFHNVEPKMFHYAYESLQAQTLGFLNIEWIVVLHNTDQKYVLAVHEMLDAHENVIILELNNNIHTPSSPRNYGMKFATAPYLGFLDADDGYTPECLQTALAHLIDTQSDIVVFRREYEMETEGLMPATEIVLWDQTREEIVIDRENWDDEKMFGGLFWGMVTSRLYRREFLTCHHFAFDETVPFTEDVLFLIELYGKAQRICYLPQLIGYHYFINSHSLVQSIAEKSGKTLVSYAVGFRKIFETAFKNGIYIDELMAMLLATFARGMLQTRQLSLAERQEIKEILAPYVHQIRMLPVSKLISAAEAKSSYSLPREVILHPENFDQGIMLREIRDGQDILLDILEKNQDTDYGRRYRFSHLRSREGYQARVPLADYQTYSPLIKLQTRIGESGIFTASSIPCYLLTADTDGVPQFIPATAEHLQPYCQEFNRFVRGKTTFLLGESLPQERKYNDQAALNSLYGWMIADYFHQEVLGLGTSKARFTAPPELIFPPEAMDTIYLRLLFALRQRDVEQIFSPFTWGVLEAFTFLEKHWENLCHDIACGEITFALDVPDEFLKRLQSYLTPDSQRAQELRQIFAQGFNRPIARLIWPKLQRLVAFGSSSFAVYTKALARYIGDLPHDNGMLASSVSLTGRAVADSDTFELITDNNFYEFRPCKAAADTRPLFISELECGEDYELILTTRSGLYRFATADIIHIEECREGKIFFTYVGRLNEGFSLPAGFVREQEIYHAIETAAEDNAITILDYAYFLQTENGTSQLSILLESADQEPDLAASIEKKLCKASKAYAIARKQTLSPSSVSYLKPETHLLYRDMLRFRHKTAPDQIQPTHILDTPAKVKFFLGSQE